jgi:Cys-rich four helix bundle protein (predicted Tat secretion target)
MNRRNALTQAAATLLAVASTASLAQDHAHHGHMAASAPAASGNYKALIGASADCVVQGQACLAHCLVLLADGDKSMGPCAKSVNQMLAVCGALQSLAAQQSALVPALAKTALRACEECEKECRVHEKHHATCKACMEACANCIKQCKAVAA